ncbi:MAG: hypothetical protein NTX51_14170 [Verrucomicrobia bacterium]|nr:hypothetical protein [Verrucomicrobiota bacterium]
MAAYALTIFIGAFLLFQVQPLMGKHILPWFGGGPGVWTTCMLFFQVLLLGGYAYAHFTSRWLKPRTQAVVHLVLLLTALALLPITPGDAWKPHGDGNPTLQILVLLAASLGLPYFVLSATGPLIQHWFSRANPGVSPYRLYALSNVGSLLALVSYPFYFETRFTRIAQATLWGWGLLAYVLCCGLCAVRLWKVEGKVQDAETGSTQDTSRPAAPAPAPSAFTRLLWLLLPACASILLLATTNKLCQDVACGSLSRLPSSPPSPAGAGRSSTAATGPSGNRWRFIAAGCSSAAWCATANSTVSSPIRASSPGST